MPTTARDKIQAILKKTVANGCTVEEMLTANRMAAAVAAKHGIPNRDIDWPKLPDGYKWAGRDIVEVVPEPEPFVDVTHMSSAASSSSYRQRLNAAFVATVRAARTQTMNPNAGFQTFTIGGQTHAVPAGRGWRQDAAILLMQCKGGATANDLMAVTGWAPHSLRGFISTENKRRGSQGFAPIRSQRARGGATTYWID